MNTKIILFLLLSTSVFSCNQPVPTQKRTVASENDASQTHPQNNQNESKPAAINDLRADLQPADVTLKVKIPTVSGIDIRVLEPEPLENETDKPGKLHPRCVTIDFKGDYAKGNSADEAWFPAQIMICPISEYPQVLAKSQGMVEGFKDRIALLSRILLLKPTRMDGQFAILDYIDAEPAFFVNLKYSSFKSGEGFFVMTQYIAEPTLINNEELLYIFQGFTADKKFYVLGTFPISSKHLPAKSDSEKVTQDGDEYEEYIVNVKKLLKDKSAFTPRLDQIQETIQSLKINSVPKQH